MAFTPEPPVHYRIGWVSGGFLIAFSVAVDALQIFFSLFGITEVISMGIGYIADVVIPATAWLLGVSFTSGKMAQKWMILAAEFAVELAPFINDVPGYTIGTVALILVTRGEDRALARKRAAAERAAATHKSRMIAEQQAYVQAANDNARLEAEREAA
jgi:hypothetical protein